jgi:hypothetical protein
MGLHSRFIKPARSRFSLDILLLTVTAAMTLVGTVAVLAPPPDPDRGVAVIFSPWTAAGDALAQSSAAGGRFVRFGAFPFIAVVVPDGPGYVDACSGVAPGSRSTHRRSPPASAPASSPRQS